MTAPRRLRPPLVALGVLASLSLRAQTVSVLATEVKELGQALANSSRLTSEGVSLISKFGSFGTGLASDQAKELLSEFSADTAAGNLPEQLQDLYTEAEQAKQIVNGVNSDLPETPDFSHLDYCAQAEASTDQIERIEATIRDLNTLAQDAQSFKSVLIDLDSLSSALGQTFEKLTGLDPVTQETTYGAFAAKWQFFTDPENAGSKGDPNAAFLISNARADWDVVETQARQKAQKLRTTLDTRRAFQQHFYSLAEQKCEDDRARAAALASFSGQPSLMPLMPSSGSSATPDDCQAAGARAEATAASCMHPQASSCATFNVTAKCYALAAAQCGSCACSGQFESAGAQARASARAICAQ